MADSGGVRTINPEFGAIRTPILVAAGVAVVLAAAPVVADASGEPLAGTVLYVVTGAFVIVTLGRELRRQRQRNPNEFVAVDVVARFYEHERPTPGRHLTHLVGTVVGAAAVGRGTGPALDRTSGALLVLERLIAGDPLPSIDPANAAWGAVLVAGVVVFALAVDRLVIGSYRELQYRLTQRA